MPKAKINAAKPKPAKMVNLRISAELIATLDALAIKQNRTRTNVIITILKERLGK